MAEVVSQRRRRWMQWSIWLGGGLWLALALAHSTGAEPGAEGEQLECICSMIEIIAAPERFDGKLIRTMGVARVGFEETGVFVSRDAAENLIFLNGIRVSGESPPKSLNMRWVLVEGRFHKPLVKGSGWRGYFDEIKYLYVPADVPIEE